MFVEKKIWWFCSHETATQTPGFFGGAKDWKLSSTRALDWFYNAIRTLGVAGWCEAHMFAEFPMCWWLYDVTCIQYIIQTYTYVYI